MGGKKKGNQSSSDKQSQSNKKSGSTKNSGSTKKTCKCCGCCSLISFAFVFGATSLVYSMLGQSCPVVTYVQPYMDITKPYMSHASTTVSESVSPVLSALHGQWNELAQQNSIVHKQSERVAIMYGQVSEVVREKHTEFGVILTQGCVHATHFTEHTLGPLITAYYTQAWVVTSNYLSLAGRVCGDVVSEIISQGSELIPVPVQQALDDVYASLVQRVEGSPLQELGGDVSISLLVSLVAGVILLPLFVCICFVCCSKRVKLSWYDAFISARLACSTIVACLTTVATYCVLTEPDTLTSLKGSCCMSCVVITFGALSVLLNLAYVFWGKLLWSALYQLVTCVVGLVLMLLVFVSHPTITSLGVEVDGLLVLFAVCVSCVANCLLNLWQSCVTVKKSKK